ncbi:MAG: HD-GYP domain [Candidatus Ozemobacter sibiricus]|uniref:HD-GYP domain n=1 Tax=Candidatus Ozemobacter sibiricus TaxID=2268124 RepID=A0A367ZR25_9BACT|nr:MAG: HD-GYP domain [Candidatus Ozemobacter sibiricus]
MQPHTRQTFERLARLSDLSMALSAGLELPDLLKKIAASVREAIQADEAYLMLLQADTYELTLAAAAGRPRRRPARIRCPERRTCLSSTSEYGFSPCPPPPERVPDDKLSGEGVLLRNAFISRQRLMFTRQLDDPLFADVPFQAAVILPLQTATQMVGLLVVANLRRKAAFSVNDLEDATVHANLAAMAIEHFKLVREREERIREMEKLNTLAKRFSTVQTLEGLIGLSFEYLAQIIPHELGVVMLFQNDEETRYFVSNRPLSPTSLRHLTDHLQEISAKIRSRPAKVVKSQQLFLSTMDPVPLGQVLRARLHSFLTVPLTVQGTNIGLINLSATRPHAFSREHLRTFTTLSSLLATAVENVKSRLFLERKVEETSVLFEISQSLTSTLVLDEVLDSIVNFSMEMMHALRCELRLLDPTGQFLEVRAARGLSKSFLNATPIKVGEGILGTVISKKLPISVVDARKDPRTKYLSVVKRERLAGLLSVPIMQRGTPIGVITLYTSKPRDFTQNEIDLLTTFASQASIAIENAQLYAKMKDQYLSMVMALAAAIEAKDSYTHGHSQKVMEYAVKIARRMNLPEDEVETIRYAGLLHDIGKIGIKDVILGKPGKLTAEELTEMRKHPRYGATIMEQVDLLREIAPLTLYHHECFDGSGYPMGLKGKDIPLGARILAVADMYDSMVADRPYRKAFPIEQVVQEMRKVAGTQLDPEIVHIFLEILREEGVLGKTA